ncbi:hypothetical protein [Candidatus Regiella insecticola]|uniref:hypothetical protein n=1 Tax=Candidatus Regiella insecticola TaxID=138073 RepID=UPI0030D9D75A
MADSSRPHGMSRLIALLHPGRLAVWLEQFNLIQGVGAKTVQIVRQATTTQNQIKLLQP